MSAAVETEVLDAPPKTEPAKLSAVKVYNPIEEGIALMLEKHGHVLKAPPDVSTATGMETARKGRKEMVSFRTTLEKVRKAEKESSLRYGQLVDSEAKRITGIAGPIEKAYDDAITAWEEREEKRKVALSQRVEEIRGTPARMLGKPLADIELAIEALQVLPQDFQELQEAAQGARDDAMETLTNMAERERDIARQREELEREQAEQQRVAGIRARIAEITELLTVVLMCRTAERVQKLVDRCAGVAIDDTFQELQAEAEQERDRVLGMLREIHGTKEQAEKDAADLAALRADKEKRDTELRAREAAAAPPPAPAPAIIVPAPSYSRRAAPAPPSAPAAPAPLFGNVVFAGASPDFGVVTLDAPASYDFTAPVPSPAPAAPSDADLIAVAVNAVADRYDMPFADAMRRLSSITWTV